MLQHFQAALWLCLNKETAWLIALCTQCAKDLFLLMSLGTVLPKDFTHSFIETVSSVWNGEVEVRTHPYFIRQSCPLIPKPRLSYKLSISHSFQWDKHSAFSALICKACIHTFLYILPLVKGKEGALKDESQMPRSQEDHMAQWANYIINSNF